MTGNLYAAGYKRAADLLVEHGVTYGEQHILVYPIIFLYRQYIELRLKDITRNGYRLLGIPKHLPLGHPTGHTIDEYWRECRGILEKVDEDEYKRLREDERNKYKSDLDALQEGINRFSEWDPNSQASRFPTDKKGNTSTLDPSSINFISLKELMQRISYLLDGISVGISEYLNAKHEMNSQM